MFSQELNEMWASCSAAEASAYAELPNGKYIVRIDAVRVDEPTTRNDKELPACVRYDMTVVQGKFARSKCQKQDYLNNPKSLAFVKRDMSTLGCVIPKRFDDVATAFQAAVGKTAEVEVKHTTSAQGKDFMNIYINRMAEVMAPSNSPLDNPFIDPLPDSAIPF